MIRSQHSGLFEPADRRMQVVHQSIRQRVDPAVNAEALAARPSIVHENIRRDVLDLPDNVKFAQTVEAGALIRDGPELGAVLMKDLANRV